MYDPCMIMYVKRFCQCREGLHALPKTMFDLFKSGWAIFVEGHEALPWVRTYDQWLEMYVDIMRDKVLTCIVEH